MSMVNADLNALLQTVKNMQTAINSIEATKVSISTKYQHLGNGWNDKKYKDLGDIVNDCSKSLNTILKTLLQGEKYVALLVKGLQEYENVNFNANSTSVQGRARQLSSSEVNSRWESGVKNIDELIDNYRVELHNRGVPECQWLNDTLAIHRAAMLEQYGYDLDVASGHGSDSVHNSEAYPNIGDYHLFYDNLADQFRQHSLIETNPHYSEAPQWRNNCQRCVPTLEMRRRGSEVTARPSTYGSEHLSYRPFDVWQNANVIQCEGNGMSDIQNAMNSWGDGARAQIVVYWDSPHGGGHTFIAEQRNGETIFSDPQTGRFDVSNYFNRVLENRTQFCRIDNLEFSNYIEECYQEV